MDFKQKTYQNEVKTVYEDNKYTRRDAMGADISMVRRDSRVDDITQERLESLRQYNETVVINDESEYVYRIHDKFNRLFGLDDRKMTGKNKDAENAQNAQAAIGNVDKWIKATDVKGRKGARLRAKLEKDFEGLAGRSTSKRMKKIEKMNALARDIKAKSGSLAQLKKLRGNWEDDNARYIQNDEKMLNLQLEILESRKKYQHEFIKAYAVKGSRTEKERLAQVEYEFQHQKNMLLNAFYDKYSVAETYKASKEVNSLGAEVETDPNAVVEGRPLITKENSAAVRRLLNLRKINSTIRESERDETKAKEQYYTIRRSARKMKRADESESYDKTINQESYEEKITPYRLNRQKKSRDMLNDVMDKKYGGKEFREYMLYFAGVSPKEYVNPQRKSKKINTAVGNVGNYHMSSEQQIILKLDKSFQELSKETRDALNELFSCKKFDDLDKVAGIMERIISGTYDDPGELTRERLRTAMLQWMTDKSGFVAYKKDDPGKLDTKPGGKETLTGKFCEKWRDGDEELEETRFLGVVENTDEEFDISARKKHPIKEKFWQIEERDEFDENVRKLRNKIDEYKNIDRSKFSADQTADYSSKLENLERYYDEVRKNNWLDEKEGLSNLADSFEVIEDDYDELVKEVEKSRGQAAEDRENRLGEIRAELAEKKKIAEEEKRRNREWQKEQGRLADEKRAEAQKWKEHVDNLGKYGAELEKERLRKAEEKAKAEAEAKEQAKEEKIDKESETEKSGAGDEFFRGLLYEAASDIKKKYKEDFTPEAIDKAREAKRAEEAKKAAEARAEKEKAKKAEEEKAKKDAEEKEKAKKAEEETAKKETEEKAGKAGEEEEKAKKSEEETAKKEAVEKAKKAEEEKAKKAEEEKEKAKKAEEEKAKKDAAEKEKAQKAEKEKAGESEEEKIERVRKSIAQDPKILEEEKRIKAADYDSERYHVKDVEGTQKTYQVGATCWSYALSNVIKSIGIDIEPEAIREWAALDDKLVTEVDPATLKKGTKEYSTYLNNLKVLEDIHKRITGLHSLDINEIRHTVKLLLGNKYSMHTANISYEELNKQKTVLINGKGVTITDYESEQEKKAELKYKFVEEIRFALSAGSAVAFNLGGHYITIVGMRPGKAGLMLRYKDSNLETADGPDAIHERSVDSYINALGGYDTYSLYWAAEKGKDVSGLPLNRTGGEL